LVVAGYLLVKIKKNNRYKYIILLLAFASLLIRGVDFQALPFYYAIATLLIVILVKLEQYQLRYFSTSILGILAAMSLALFMNQEKINNNQVPQSSDFQQLSDFVTNKSDKVFSYTFKNSEYILADRLPASNDYFYLPAQAEYYKNPILGVENDICEQLKSVAPKVGYFEKYDWSEEFKWDVYATCVNELLATEYQNLTFNTLFIRKDLLIKESIPAIKNVEYEFRPSGKLAQSNQLEINFPESLKKYPAEIERIGILFATHGEKISGSIQLEVRDLDSQVINYEVDGQDIIDNRYTFINLKNHKVNQISLKSTRDIEISTWESVSADQSNTCILLKFVKSKWGWGVAALLTPVTILTTGAIFFSLIISPASFETLTSKLGTTPLLMAVLIGAMQNILSKAAKYSLFDPCKEMAFIPLDAESKTKGKAAVDVIGSPLGKSGGSLIQQIYIGVFGSLVNSTPYLGGTLALIVLLWLRAARSLSRQFAQKVKESSDSGNNDLVI
jgi:hypothetical protein